MVYGAVPTTIMQIKDTKWNFYNNTNANTTDSNCIWRLQQIEILATNWQNCLWKHQQIEIHNYYRVEGTSSTYVWNLQVAAKINRIFYKNTKK